MLSDVPRDLLRTLVAAVDEGTLDAAATALSITPSAVSQRIRALETRFGRVVLTRSKPVRATPDGDILVRLGRAMALLEHEALEQLGAGTARMRVSLGANADSLGTWFLPAIAEVCASHRIAVELHREDQEHTARLLESGVVMGAVTSQRDAVPGCTVTPLGSQHYRAVASNAFADEYFPDGITSAALSTAPYVDFDRDDELQRRFLDAHGITQSPPRHLVAGSAEFVSAIRLGMGWGMALPDHIDDPRAEPLVELGAPAINVPLYWQRWELRSEILDAITAAVVRGASAAHSLTAAERSSPGRSKSADR